MNGILPGPLDASQAMRVNGPEQLEALYTAMSRLVMTAIGVWMVTNPLAGATKLNQTSLPEYVPQSGAGMLVVEVAFMLEYVSVVHVLVRLRLMAPHGSSFGGGPALVAHMLNDPNAPP